MEQPLIEAQARGKAKEPSVPEPPASARSALMTVSVPLGSLLVVSSHIWNDLHPGLLAKKNGGNTDAVLFDHGAGTANRLMDYLIWGVLIPMAWLQLHRCANSMSFMKLHRERLAAQGGEPAFWACVLCRRSGNGSPDRWTCPPQMVAQSIWLSAFVQLYILFRPPLASGDDPLTYALVAKGAGLAELVTSLVFMIGFFLTALAWTYDFYRAVTFISWRLADEIKNAQAEFDWDAHSVTVEEAFKEANATGGIVKSANSILHMIVVGSFFNIMDALRGVIVAVLRQGDCALNSQEVSNCASNNNFLFNMVYLMFGLFVFYGILWTMARLNTLGVIMKAAREYPITQDESGMHRLSRMEEAERVKHERFMAQLSRRRRSPILRLFDFPVTQRTVLQMIGRTLSAAPAFICLVVLIFGAGDWATFREALTHGAGSPTGEVSI